MRLFNSLHFKVNSFPRAELSEKSGSWRLGRKEGLKPIQLGESGQFGRLARFPRLMLEEDQETEDVKQHKLYSYSIHILRFFYISDIVYII